MNGKGGEVIIEFIPNGRFVKVTAIDSVTGKEVCIVGDARQSEQSLAQLAMRKLRHVQKRDKWATSSDDEGSIIV
jgi:hypothetical protein